jgi:hypothetical protein
MEKYRIVAQERSRYGLNREVSRHESLVKAYRELSRLRYPGGEPAGIHPSTHCAYAVQSWSEAQQDWRMHI